MRYYTHIEVFNKYKRGTKGKEVKGMAQIILHLEADNNTLLGKIANVREAERNLHNAISDLEIYMKGISGEVKITEETDKPEA